MFLLKKIKQKANWELVILILIYTNSLRILIWKNLDPSTFSASEQEKIGLARINMMREDNLKKDWL